MAADSDTLIKAIELQQQGLFEESLVPLKQFLLLYPDHPAALYSIAVSLLRTGEPTAALVYLEHGVKVAPEFAPIWFARAAALQNMGQKDEAVASYDKAVELKPDYTEALINCGALLREMFRHKESLERFNRVLEIVPDHQAALANSGIILTEFKQSELAIQMFERLLKVNPDYDYALGLLCYEKMHLCDWGGIPELSRQILDGVRAGKRSCKTLALMAITDSANDQLIAARTFAQHFYPQSQKVFWKGERYRHQKIRVAYVSPDFREHPVGHLMAGVFEYHDKSRFEIIAISLGIDDGSRLRERMLKAFDRFIDVRAMVPMQIAQLMRELEVDIAIDLAGYTSDSRTDIYAFRPAPVQASYLGYSGTLGTAYMDYIIADRHIIPETHKKYYSEKVVYLPDVYLPTDASLEISEHPPTRAECGLPDTGFVFCSFSHDYKISPRIFDVWMRLLRDVPGSVLWLMSRNETSRHNLQKEAVARGIDASRLVFAGRVPRVEDHLARYRQADLCLDTHPYNAHSTAADALMAGLPVVTYMGEAFASRVAGSLMTSLGLTELIAHSLDNYENLARKLATTPALLDEVKQQLRANKIASTLFNTGAFCRDLEAAYTAMWRRTQLGSARDALCGTD